MKDLDINHPDVTVWAEGLFDVDEDFETRGHINISIHGELFHDFLRVLYGTKCKEEIRLEIDRRIDSGNLSKENANVLYQRFIHCFHAFREAFEDGTSFSMRGPVKYL